MNNQSKINVQNPKLQLPNEVFDVKILTFASGKLGKKTIIPEKFVEFLENVATELQANAGKSINNQLTSSLSSEMHLITSAINKQSKEPLPGETAGSVGFNWLDQGTLYPVVIPATLRDRFLSAVKAIAQETQNQQNKQNAANSSYYAEESKKRAFNEFAAISQGRND